MNTAAYNHNKDENNQTAIKGIELYLDYTNKRLKILNYQGITDNIIIDIINLAKNKGLGKIISNCRSAYLQPLISNGFIIEGIINGFFQGEDAFCISYFIDPFRQAALKKEAGDSILYQCKSGTKRYLPQEKQQYIIRQTDTGDIPEMIRLFSTVFESYPSPVFSAEYLEKVMNKQLLFKVAEEDGKILSMASADMDKYNLNAEITDCVTYPEYRGKNILQNIIYSLEADLKEKGFLTAYSLARSINPGINKALSRMKYQYGGRLLKNCHICGGFEDMNIWVKSLGNKNFVELNMVNI
ncbi:MAG: putative beta-lysine N-acetyltransferase [Syntrophomonadaceae bacterium]|nr:putative beta-lysine N-acetyltransferase [Syntrophomonadaceae bacterium]MDD3023563.1 putative beta-lysine N-acetyltransferase [Syntrophomonadaceae bacterium]